MRASQKRAPRKFIWRRRNFNSMGTITTFLDALKTHIEACTPEAWAIAFEGVTCPVETGLVGIPVEFVAEDGDVEGGVEAALTKLEGRAIFLEWDGATFEKADAINWNTEQRALVSLWSSKLLLDTDAPAAKDVAETLWMWLHGTRLTLPDVPGGFNDVTAGELKRMTATGETDGTIYVVYGFGVSANRTLASDRI